MRIRSVRRVITALVTALAGCGLVGLAVFLYWQGLDRADQWSSVIAGFAGLASLVASAISLHSGREADAVERPATTAIRGAWGTFRLTAATKGFLQAQARAVQSVPYRVAGVDTVPLAAMYVRQQLEVNRSGGASEPAPPAVERMGVRLRPMSAAKVSPVAQRLEHVLDKHRHLVIEGGPGMGKSSLGRYLTLHLANAWLHSDGPAPSKAPLLPVLVTARALSRHRDRPWLDALAQACADELGQHADLATSAEVLSSVPPNVRWIVIVDGLDEVADEQRHELIDVLAERMAQAEGGARIVVLSRPLADAGWRRLTTDDTGVYALLPFTRPALRDFAAAAMGVLRPRDAPEQTERFLDQVRTRDLAEVARVPLLAAIAATVFAIDPDTGLPRTKYELYEQYLAHLAEAGRHRRSQARQQLRLRLTDVTGSQADAVLDGLFGRTQELLQHVAVAQVDTNDRLIDSALRWCRQEGLCLATVSWTDAICEVLTSTGLLVRREGDVRFIHHSFAEHVAADRQAGQLPEEFDPTSPVWLDLIRRAVDDDPLGLAVLVRWARQHPPGSLLSWLQGGFLSFHWLLLKLLTAGVEAAPEHFSATLSYIERYARQIGYSADWIISESVGLPVGTVVREWAAQQLRYGEHEPVLQTIATRLLADAPDTDRELAGAAIEYRLTDDLLPDHRQALAEAAEVLFGASDRRAADQYRAILADPRATPMQRLVAGQALADLGREYHDVAVTALLEVVNRTGSAPADRAAAARVLADLLPERRKELVAVVRSAANGTGLSDADRYLLGRVLAELDVEETAGGAGLLRGLAADVSLEPGRRWEALEVLADLGPRQREWAADVLRQMAVDPALHPWDRATAIRQLGLLGPDHFGALADVVVEFYDSRSMLRATEYPSYWLQAARAAAKLSGQRRQRVLDHLMCIVDDAGHPHRIAAAITRAWIESGSLVAASSILRSTIAAPLKSFTESEAAHVLGETDPSSTAASRAAQRAIMNGGTRRWLQVLAAQRLALSGPDSREELTALYLAMLRSSRTEADTRVRAAIQLADLEPSLRALTVEYLIALLAHDLASWSIDLAVRMLTSLNAYAFDRCVDRLADIGDGPYPMAVRIRAASTLAPVTHAAAVRASRIGQRFIADAHAAAAVQVAAVRLLAKAGSTSAPLVAVLERVRTDPHTDFSARLQAELLLTKADPEAGTDIAPWISDAINDGQTSVEARCDLAERLSVLRHPQAVEIIVNVLVDHRADDWQKRSTADLAVRCGPAAIVRAEKVLRQQIADPATADNTRTTAVAALGMLGPAEHREAALTLTRMLAAAHQPPTDVTLGICAALRDFGQDVQLAAVECLSALTAAPRLSPGERLRAITIRADMTGADGHTAASAQAVLSDPRSEASHLVAAAELLGRSNPHLGDARGALAGVRGRDDVALPVQVYAALVEADLPAADLTDRMIRHLADTDPAERLLGAWFLSRHQIRPDDRVASVLRSVAADDTFAVQLRWYAVTALGEQAAHRAVAAEMMSSLLDREDLTPGDRCQMAQRLAQFGDEGRERAAAALVRTLVRPALADRHRYAVAAELAQLSPVHRDRGAAELQTMAADQTRPWALRLAALRRLSKLSPAYHRQAVTQALIALETTDTAPARLTIAEALTEMSPSNGPAANVLHAVATDTTLPYALRLRACAAAARQRGPRWLETAETLRTIAEAEDAPPYLRRQAAFGAFEDVPTMRDWSAQWLASCCGDPSAEGSDRLAAAIAIAPSDQGLAVSVYRELVYAHASAAEVRLQAAVRLAYADREATPEAVHILHAIVDDPELRLAARLRAATYLAYAGSAYRTPAVELISAHLRSPEPRTRLLAAWALTTLSGTPRDHAIDHLTDLADSGPSRTATAAERLRHRTDRLDDAWEIPLSD